MTFRRWWVIGFLVLEVRARREGVLGARYGGQDGFTVGQLVSVEQAVLVEGGAKVLAESCVGRCWW